MMRHRDRVGLNFPPLLLRLMLAVIFLQAGLGKVLETREFAPDRAAILANMGVLQPPAASPTVGASPAAAAQNNQYTAADFPSPVRARRVYGLAIRIHEAAFPPPLEAGARLRPLWPRDLASGQWPVYFAWTVAVIEIGGAAFLLVGLLTRLAAFGIAGVMLGAIWLDQIGPKLQTGEVVLGFLPNYPVFDVSAWEKLWLQFALFMAALALAFLGPGRASLDALFAAEHDDDEE